MFLANVAVVRRKSGRLQGDAFSSPNCPHWIILTLRVLIDTALQPGCHGDSGKLSSSQQNRKKNKVELVLFFNVWRINTYAHT